MDACLPCFGWPRQRRTSLRNATTDLTRFSRVSGDGAPSGCGTECREHDSCIRLSRSRTRRVHDAEPAGQRHLPVPPPAPGQPRRLVGVGPRGVRGGPAAQRAGPAERRVRRLPLVPRDGARVVRGRGDRGVPERALREHQGRPRGAARRRRRLHAGDRRDDRAGRLADDLRARPRGQPVLRRHLLPRPAAARAAELPPAARGDRRRVDQPVRRGGRGLRPDPGGARPARSSSRAASPSTRRPSTRRSRSWRATSTPTGAVSAARRSSRRRWCWSSCCGTAATSADPDGRQDAGGDGGRRHPRPAGRRLRAVRRRPRVGGAALREDALRQRPAALGLRALGGAARRRRRRRRSPAASPTSCSPSWAPPRAPSPPRSTPTPRARRAPSTSGRRPSWPRCSARRTARGRRRC